MSLMFSTIIYDVCFFSGVSAIFLQIAGLFNIDIEVLNSLYVIACFIQCELLEMYNAA